MTLKHILFVLIMASVLGGCSPEIGSESWCQNMKDKDKGDWTASEATDFAKHCIFK
ncbi:DUF3012 domain-containing protein [Motiliproteus sp. MSK22-1]|uniref:DUF3012 domain-containing protein n=1 Tax=Motiliproteus sp. MSK22-1 TaxID=1897630 RepID=UPI00097616A0|nr:DUF3012 domain-containing protein [Motiliproteus sp. MSK22-1]